MEMERVEKDLQFGNAALGNFYVQFQLLVVIIFFTVFFLFLFAEFPLFAFFVNSNFKTHFHYQLNTTRQITELFVLIGTAAEKNKYSEISNWVVYSVCQCIWDSQIWCDIAVRPRTKKKITNGQRMR